MDNSSPACGSNAAPRIRHFHLIVATLLTVFAASSSANLAPINEAKMDEIYGASNFGANTIDIRFLNETIKTDASLATISNGLEFNDLIALGDGLGLANNVVRMFFIDDVAWCSNPGNFAGCANIGNGFNHANDIMVEIGIGSQVAPILHAHELGHSLGLEHVSLTNNLMRGQANVNNLELTSGQVADVLDLPTNLSVIQFDGQQRFIQIAPIVIQAVPLPGALLLCLSAIGALRVFGRRASA